jgi:hypothetical protein
MSEIEAVVVQADVPSTKGDILPADEVRKMADGVRLFWDESRKALVYRGPAECLPYQPTPNTSAET